MQDISETIEALVALARAETPQETMAALSSCRRLLSDDSSEDFQPLLDSLTRRAKQLYTLQKLAGCDVLTGIANRRAFMDALEQCVSQHNRRGTGLAVVLLDLDGLKQINDSLGHAAGDEAIVAVARSCESALQDGSIPPQSGVRTVDPEPEHGGADEAAVAVARTCESSVRGSDVVARLGGDEFAVLLPGATRGDAEVVARRLRLAVEAEVVAGQHLRVSLGTATAGPGPVSAASLLGRADARMYCNKRQRKAATHRAA